jgi:2-hydroxy-3-oxopropionate reductase
VAVGRRIGEGRDVTVRTVGVIGLGLMGKPLARRLLGAGFAVTVHNRSSPSMDELAAAGATRSPSPRELAEACEVVITSLPDGPDVAGVMRAQAGVFAGAHPGTLLIDMSTIAPGTAVELATEARDRGLGFLDAPVSGGPEGAGAGALAIMVGGEAADFARAEPVFAPLGKATLCGPAGSGAVVKACNQLVVGLNIAAVSEALVLARRAGVDPHTVVRVLQGGLAGSRVLELRGASMADADFTPRGKVSAQKKDLGIVLDLARRLHVSLPATAVVDQLFTSLMASGRGGLDHTALIATIAELSGIATSEKVST